MQIALFCVHEGGKPLIRSNVCPPAIKIEIMTEHEGFGIGTVKPHDVVILIFHPDSAEKSSLVIFSQWSNIEDQAANISQKLAANVVKFVVVTIEARGVQIDHLKKPARDKTYIEKFPPILRQLPL